MVFNRLCEPDSKLGVLRWLETVAIPGIEAESIIHQHLLRSMDALMDHQAEVDAVVAGLLRPSIRRAVLVADSGEPLEFVLAVPGRRDSEFTELLQPFHERHCIAATKETVGELPWRNLRLVVAHNPQGGQRGTDISSRENQGTGRTGGRLGG